MSAMFGSEPGQAFGRAREQDMAPERIARVLIVDDHDVNLRVCSALCDLFHLECECVRSGAEAIEAMRTSHFDVVLMDIHMPGMGGVEATRAIRALPRPASAVPIIAVTTDAGRDECDAYLASGMVDVVPKPITPARLFQAIASSLRSDVDEPRSWASTG